MGELAIADAAERLGVGPHRVRALVHARRLPARKVAGRFVVDEADVERLSEDRSPGRPLSPRMAWGLISLLERGQAPGLSAPERSRLRARLRQEPPLAEVARLVRGRSRVYRLRIHSGGLERARNWPGVVATGASARGHDIVDVRVVEVYVRAAALNKLVRQLHARPVHRDANLVVRVPTLADWPFPDEEPGAVTIALDLWDAGDSRSRRAARRLYERALAARRFEPTRR